ncbi:SEC-C domain-containing protein [Streptomyces sp. RB6PN25]|uniref:SEC-C domain-containing protein n=1 Tax=Streptomyces humicola TaxID=2953240 RepID=A0ABT1Q4W8_9ACTN|nr:SEC-C metal-binding domain-containing protein [Streptomyces humicola]MCQ4084964.1 SEC-C domain-containing protein [Streptomyces humicola]
MSKKHRPSPSPPDPHASAVQAEDRARTHPEDDEELLIEAAGEWEAAGAPDQALAICDRLLSRSCANAPLVEALRIGILWDTGRETEAREAAERLRATHPHNAETWHAVAEVFEAGGDLPTAAQWFTAGITHVLGASPYPDAVRRAGADAEDLFIGRHRVRRRLGLPHDDWDAIADTLHPAPLEESATPTPPPADLAARIAALHTHQPVMIPYWPEPEFTELLRRHPDLAGVLGTDHATHRHRVELRLRALHAESTSPLGVTSTTASAYESFMATRPDASPDAFNPDPDIARAVPWPPHRNEPCWCGSGLKYKKCCGDLPNAPLKCEPSLHVDD